MIYFTADTHLGHKNVIEYSTRPFINAEEMDEVLIKNWNSLVQPCDEVYHLGDFSFHKPAKTAALLNKLNGQKYLIQGNHDRHNLN